MTALPMKVFLGLLASLFISVTAFAEGRLERRDFHSPALGVRKTYRIYLPDGYNAGTARFPVIYLLHGWGVTQDYWADSLGLANAADAMNLRAVVVMPDGDRSYYANSPVPADYRACMNDLRPTRNRTEKRADFCVRTPRYEDYIIEDLIRHIDATYRTVAKREARAISGESAGGFGAMQLALRHKDVFSAVAAHSAFLSLLYEGPRPYQSGKVILRNSLHPAVTNPMVEFFGRDLAYWRRYDPASLVNTLANGELAIYFDCGMQDDYGFHDEALYFHDLLRARGIDHRFESVPGKHHDDLWTKRIKHSLRFHADHFQQMRVSSEKQSSDRRRAALQPNSPVSTNWLSGLKAAIARQIGVSFPARHHNRR